LLFDKSLLTSHFLKILSFEITQIFSFSVLSNKIFGAAEKYSNQTD